MQPQVNHFFKEYNELFFLIEYVNEKQIVRHLGTQVEFHEYHNLNLMYIVNNMQFSN